MIFRLGIMDKLKTNFCNCLKKWVENNFRGTRTELGKFFNVSQGQVSNVLACRKAGAEPTGWPGLVVFAGFAWWVVTKFRIWWHHR